MKKVWNKIDAKWQLILKIAAILSVLTGGGFTIRGAIDWGKEIKTAPNDINTLFMAVDDINRYIKKAEKAQEMVWQMFRENTEDPDPIDYFITYEDGSVIDVDIRKSHLGNDIAFLFDYTFYPARWSATDRKYYILDGEGKSILIYRKDGN